MKFLFLIFTFSIFANENLYRIPDVNEIFTSIGQVTSPFLPMEMSILVWNLHKGENANFSEDFLILTKHKDLIITQEILLDELTTLVLSRLPSFYFNVATSFFVGKNEHRTGVSTASSVQAIELNYIRTDVHEPITNTPKLSLITSYPIKNTNKKLTVVNIHGINFVENKYFDYELEKLSNLIQKISNPIIFAGDFNTWNKERLKKLNEIRERLNLKEAFFVPDFRKKFKGNPLDHFLYSRDLIIKSAKVEDEFKGSDHNPIEIFLEFDPKF